MNVTKFVQPFMRYWHLGKIEHVNRKKIIVTLFSGFCYRVFYFDHYENQGLTDALQPNISDGSGEKVDFSGLAFF